MSDRKWQSWFYPNPTGDVGRDRNARTLQFTCLLFALAIGLVAILDVVSREPFELPILITAMVALIGAACMNRAGMSTWAARIAILAVLLTAILLVLQARDGFRSHAMLVFPGLLLISVTLLDRASYIATAGIVLLAVAALGTVERLGLTAAVPGWRTPTTYESIFYVDLTLVVFAVIGSRIAGDAEGNVLDLRDSIDRLSAANLELIQTAAALSQSEKIYRAIGESLDYGVWVCAPDGRNTYHSESFLKLVGQTQEQCADFGWVNLLHPEDAERTIAAWRECVRTEGRWDLEHRFRGQDGEWHPVLSRGVPVRDEMGRITCWAGINLDIGALKTTRASLRDSERRARTRAAELQAIMDAAPAMILVAGDVECRHVDGNRTAYALMRQRPGTNLSLAAPEGERPTNRRVMQDGIEIPSCEMPLHKAASSGRPIRNYDLEVVFEDGTSTDLLGNVEPILDEKGNPQGAVAVLSDITERKRAQQDALARQRLESVGALASGIAHDFNNLLSGVLVQADLALQELTTGVNPEEELRGIREGAIRGSEIVRQLMVYSGKESEVPELVDVSRIVEEMLDLLRIATSKRAAMETDLGKGLPYVRANPAQLRQIVMNLVTNAGEAIGEHEGVISIKTRCVTVGRDLPRMTSEHWATGDYLRLEVSDTGCGIPLEAQTRMFEPFFTTKSTGRGLGLAVVHDVVQSLGGMIRLESEPGKGTKFQILLPCAEVAAAATDEPACHPEKPAIPLHKATILIAEDEDPLRRPVSKMLQREGFDVIEASDGYAALKAIHATHRRIDVLLLDVTLPGAPSREVFEQAKRLRPDMKVIVTSAYSEEMAAASLTGRFKYFIRKPYRLDDLVQLIRPNHSEALAAGHGYDS